MRSALGVVLLTVGVACSGADLGSDVGAVGERRFTESDDHLKFTLEDSPSGGAKLDFCGTEPAGTLDLNTAAWLTFFAGNEYAHFGYLGPMLNKLGFGNPFGAEAASAGGLDYLWEGCAIDLYDMRAFEKNHAPELATLNGRPAKMLARVSAELDDWGACAHKWFDESGYTGSLFPVASFEKWLVQTGRPGSYIQFFGGGNVERGGSFFQEGSTQVMYMRHGTLPVAIISFRGTEPEKWLDIVADAVAFQVPYLAGWGSVHEGFNNAYESVQPMLDATLAELEGTGVRIYITGHSLGGGLATLLTADILQRIEDGADFELRGMYNVGSPRVGNTTFKTKFDQMAARHGVNVMRFQNDNDIVTKVPRLQDWAHVDKLVYLDAESVSLPASAPWHWTPGSASDHHVDAYYSRIIDRMDDPAFKQYLSCD